MGEQVFGTFALGLDNISWVIVAEIWLYTISGKNPGQNLDTDKVLLLNF